MPTHAIALLIEPGSTLSSVMTSLDMMSIARRYSQALPDTLADYAAVILPGFLAEGLPALTQQLHSVWQTVLDRLEHAKTLLEDSRMSLEQIVGAFGGSRLMLLTV